MRVLNFLQLFSNIILHFFVIMLINLNNANNIQYRLPTSVFPVSYSLFIHFSSPGSIFDTVGFDGTVYIVASVTAETENVTLNVGPNLRLMGGDFSVDERSIGVKDTQYDIISHTFIYHLDSPLKEGDHVHIKIAFSSDMRESRGIKKMILSDSESAVIATLFEPFGARNAFPCFDEPSFRAKFDLSLHILEHWHALSNTPEEEVFSSVKKEDGVIISTWGVPTANSLEHLSTIIAYRVMVEMERFTGISYKQGNMTKFDQLAIPGWVNANENWGIVKYSDKTILREIVQNGSYDRVPYGRGIVAHETSHMWFGNLVTVQWWDVLWLKESLASFMEHFIIDKIYPESQAMEELVITKQFFALSFDSDIEANAMNAEVKNSGDGEKKYSWIAYAKGSSIIRMIYLIMGPSNFQKAMKYFLQLRKYSAATSNDFFDALEIYKPNSKHLHNINMNIFDIWTRHAGYPVLTFQVLKNKIIVNQTRFLDDPEDEDSTLYPVPLSWKTNDGRTQRILMTKDKVTTKKGVPRGANGWYIVDNTGYFRVMYDMANWNTLTKVLKSSRFDDISPLQRATLINDAKYLSSVGILSVEVWMELFSSLRQETSKFAVRSAQQSFGFLLRMFNTKAEEPHLKTYLRNLIEPHYTRIRFQENEGKIENIQDANLLATACSVDIDDCHRLSVELSLANKNGSQQTPANIRDVIFCYGVRAGPSSLWNHLWSKFLSTKDRTGRLKLARILGCSKEESKLHRLLKYTLLESIILEKDAPKYFYAVYSNPDGVKAALDFLTENFQDLRRRYSHTLRSADRMKLDDMNFEFLQSSGYNFFSLHGLDVDGTPGYLRSFSANSKFISTFDYLILGLSKHLANESELQKIQFLINKYPSAFKNTKSTVLETLNTTLAWLKTNKDKVLSAIKKFDSSIEFQDVYN